MSSDSRALPPLSKMPTTVQVVPRSLICEPTVKASVEALRGFADDHFRHAGPKYAAAQ